MTITNSLFQLLFLFNEAKDVGHQIISISDSELYFGWTDLDTCVSLKISQEDALRVISAPENKDPQALEDYQKCLNVICEGYPNFWQLYQALLKIPQGRKYLFTSVTLEENISRIPTIPGQFAEDAETGPK